MASKTVTRSTDRTIHKVYISFQISQRVFFSASTIHAQWKKLSFPLNSSNDTLIVFLSCMCELISMAGSNFLDTTYVQIWPTYLFDGHPLSKKPSTPKMSLGIAYMKYVPVFAVFCAHIISSHQVMGYFSRNFTFVENDEQTDKLVFCHSKEARSFTTRNALSVNMKKEGVFHCVLQSGRGTNERRCNGLPEYLYTGNVDINEHYVFDWFQLEGFRLVPNLKVAGICRHSLLFLKFRHKMPLPWLGETSKLQYDCYGIRHFSENREATCWGLDSKT